MPAHVGSHFAGAVQFVRGLPFFRLVSRSALHFTPAARLRFLTFETDEANTMAIPLTASAAFPPRSSASASEDASQNEDEDASEGYSLLQKSVRVSCGTAPSSLLRSGGTDLAVGTLVTVPEQALAMPSPLRRRAATISGLEPSVFRGSPDGPASTTGHTAATLSALPRGHNAREDASCPPLPCHDLLPEPASAPNTLKSRTLETELRAPLRFSQSQHVSLQPDTCEIAGPDAQHDGPLLPAEPDKESESGAEHLPVLSEVLVESTPVRDLASLLHSITLWGHECWQPIRQLRIPGWISQLLPSTNVPPGVNTPTAYHVYTDGSADHGKAGWGAVLVAEYQDPSCRCAVAFMGHQISRSGGFGSFSAQTNNAAEAWAVLITQLAALALPVFLPLTFWIDSSVTIGSATGLFDPALIQGDPALSNAVRASAQALQQRPAPTQWRWVPGHSRAAFNELADHVAGLASRGKAETPISRTMQRLARHELLPWAWRLLARTNEVPVLEHLAAGRYEPPDALPSACAQAIVDDVQLPVCRSSGSLPCRILTANLCTGAGKQGPLLTQLDAAGVDIAFFQETRSRTSKQCSGRWLQFCAAADRGRGGCSVWIRQGWCLGDRPIARTDCTVLAARADFIAIRVKVAGCSLVLVNLHGPHSQHTPQVISDWWQDTNAAIKALCGDDHLIVGGDFNARLSPNSECTGGHGPDACDEAGTHVQRLCSDLHLFLANTYETVMGDHRAATWKDRRLDYLAVPACCICTCRVAAVDFDLLNPHEDHQALCIDMSLWAGDSSPPSDAAHKANRTRARSRTLAGRDAHWAAVALETLTGTTQRWATNVHTHADALFSQAQHALDAAPARTAFPNKPFTSPETMEFIQQRKHCDKLLRQIDAEERCRRLRRFFTGWCSLVGSSAAVASPASSDLHRARAACLRARAIWCTCVRRHLRLDKALYVETACAELHDAASRKDSAALFARLRYFRPASKRVLKPFGPLDILRCPDGTVAGTYEEQQELRGQHFGAMEAALKQSAAEFARYEVLPAAPSGRFRLDQLPSLLDVEQVVRSLPRRKAAGPSGVPNELWKASPATAAGIWLPVVLKQHVRLTEPVRFSTGILATLFKGKGDPSQVTSHRSIFLLEGLGKACRKMVRVPLLDALQASCPPLFEGCRPGSSSEVLTHYITSFRDYHALRGWSTCCLFLDLSSAYYRVIRAKVTEEEWTDDSICHVLAQMGVSPALFDSIRAWLSGGSVTSGVEPHHRDVLRAAFRSSGFLLRNMQHILSYQIRHQAR